jgi:cobaltochelatase CobS
MSNATLPHPTTDGSYIVCQECGARIHAVQIHLKEKHPGMTMDEYRAKFVGAPEMSEIAQRRVRERQEAMAKSAAAAPASKPEEKVTLAELFGFPKNHSAVVSARGAPIMISRLAPSGDDLQMVPDIDPDYHFAVPVLKDALMGLETNMPVYIQGHAGTGKTTLFEQIAARTNRPMIRVQHTGNMEEDQVLGGWRLRNGQTVFEHGPLATAMKNGWLYLADEYDFGRPEVLSVYQPVLEGKPLVIKEADPANRVVRPHPNFRIVATGNTNGQGDPSGLYSGVSQQNAANFERFSVMLVMPWIPRDLEVAALMSKAGIAKTYAEALVDFATRVREEFEGSKLGNPISPRALIAAAKLGRMKRNFVAGLEMAFLNRLTPVDREACAQTAQRLLGGVSMGGST